MKKKIVTIMITKFLAIPMCASNAHHSLIHANVLLCFEKKYFGVLFCHYEIKFE